MWYNLLCHEMLEYTDNDPYDAYVNDNVYMVSDIDIEICERFYDDRTNNDNIPEG